MWRWFLRRRTGWVSTESCRVVLLDHNCSTTESCLVVWSLTVPSPHHLEWARGTSHPEDIWS